MALLDTLTVNSAVAAYSTRKLRNAYAGSCMRVRRSSDNAEADIGFDGNGNLDTTALLAHVGANSGFVRTWYDQSGNAINIINATAANQPRIVNAGTVELMDTKPAVRFIAANSTQLDSPANSMANATYFAGGTITVSCVYLCASALANFNLYNTKSGADTWQRFSTAAYDGNFNATRLTLAGGGLPNTGRRVFQCTRTGTVMDYRVDGAVYAFQNDTQALSTTFVQLGRYQLNSTFYDGHIAELIIQTGLAAADRIAVGVSQGAQWNITMASPEGSTSSAEVVNALFQNQVEGTTKLIEALRIIMAPVAGNAVGLDGNPQFKGLDTTTTRVTETIAGETRTITSRDGTLGSDSFTAPSTSAAAIATAILDNAVEGGVTLKGIVRLLMAFLAGNATGLDSSPQFKSLSGSKTRVAGVLTGGSRTVTTVDTTD